MSNIVTKAELDAQLANIKSIEGRATAAERKVKDLESEKAGWIAQGSYVPVGNRSDSDEARTLKYFQVSSVKQLIEVNVASTRFARVPNEMKQIALNVKRAIDINRWINQRFRGGAMDIIGVSDQQDHIANLKGILDSRWAKEFIVPMLKAFGSTVVGAGDEWVPTAIASSYIEEFELEFVLENRFRTINMPTNPFQMPFMKGVTKARKIAESATATEANFSTDIITFGSQKLVEYMVLPEELTEDSAPDFLAAGRDEVVKAQVRAVEAADINGDDDGTHIDSDTQAGAADLAEKAWKGLRRQAIANSANGVTLDFSNAAITETNLRTLRGRGGKFFSNPNQCLWIVGPIGYTEMLALPSVTTIDKFGPQATVIKGSLANYQGIPIVNSEYMREDLNASGVYDGVTTNRAAILLVNTTRWYHGQRRPIQVKLQQSLPADDKWLLASYQRKTFVGHPQGAVEKSVAYGYNIAT